MLVVMVRIPIGSARDAERLEERFRDRLGLAQGQPGFIGFELLKGRDEFISVTRWATRADLDNWMRSRTHAEAHGRTPHPTGGGHPQSGPLPSQDPDATGGMASASTMIYEVIIASGQGC
jgi:heme-degrading monooxygenase HmoA